MKEIVKCATCGRELDVKEDGYIKVLDNYLQQKYFDELDESDNIFCSESCLCEALTAERVYE